MRNQPNSKNIQNKYKDLIIERLNPKNNDSVRKKNDHMQSLKTQCTPNDKTQDLSQDIF